MGQSTRGDGTLLSKGQKFRLYSQHWIGHCMANVRMLDCIHIMILIVG